MKALEIIIKSIVYAYSFTIGFPYHFAKGFIRGWRRVECED